MKELLFSGAQLANKFKFFLLQECDFQLAKDFLDGQRDGLERKEFFLPYTDEELSGVLANGKFVAMMDNQRLVGTFALDLDKQYATQLGSLVTECSRGKFVLPFAYETSGFVIEKSCRGRGLGKLLMTAVLALANHFDGHLCGVVHIENIASAQSFLSNGFVLCAVKDCGDGYKFGYFVRETKRAFAQDKIADKLVPLDDIDGHKTLLSQGYVGVQLENNCFAYAKYFE
ncbi:MAG: GNAT family N-acetyltransferase [Clostridia bacterium]